MGVLAAAAVTLPLALGACQAIRAVTTVPTTDLSALANKTPSGVYLSDPDHTAVLFSVRHFRFAQAIGRLRDVAAKLEWNLEEPDKSKVDVTFRTASLDTNSPSIDSALKAKSMFDVVEFPEGHFVSTKVERAGTNAATGTITGDLTLRGETHPVTLAVTFNGGDIDGLTLKPTLGFAATAVLRRAEWHLGEWIPVVGNEVKLTIEIEFVRSG
ncbi:MAG: YceI family protein [Alphaproteobacteria bacterium]